MLLQSPAALISSNCQAARLKDASSAGYLRVNDVVLDLLLRDGDVLQDHLQPHGHHAGHPVDQDGADVAGHPPLDPREGEEKLHVTGTHGCCCF